MSLIPYATIAALVALVLIQLKLRSALKKLISAQETLIESQEALVGRLATRIDILSKLACCGCGHLIGRHDDPDSADGFGCRDCQCQAIHNLVDEIDKDRRTAWRR